VTRFGELAGSDQGRYERLADTLVGHGVWVARRGIWYVSAAHTPADAAETLGRVDAAFGEFSRAG